MLPETHFSILKSIWKWKILSTSAIWVIQDNRDKLENTYKKLCALENSKLVKPVSFSSGLCVWTLTKQGLALLQSEIPSLHSMGSASEHLLHDYWVTTIHLGEWARNIPDGVSLISEQELRRMSSENLPDGVPDSINHRSDGFWLFLDGHGKFVHSISLEVERSLKPESIYKSYFDFYDLEYSVTSVVWPVANKSIEGRLTKILKSGLVFRPEIHFLFPIKDFLSFGWDCTGKNTSGSEISLFNLLCSKQVSNALQVRSSTEFNNLLNLRKKPTISSSSNNFKISKILY